MIINFTLHSVGEVQGVLTKYVRTYNVAPHFKAECLVYLSKGSTIRLYLKGNSEYTETIKEDVDYGGYSPMISYKYIHHKAHCSIIKVEEVLTNVIIKDYEDMLNN